MSSGGARRRAAAALAILVVVLAPARPAAADPPRPTNYRSEVLRVSPEPSPGIEVRVVGGDGFLELRVPDGHTAVVTDYGSPTTGAHVVPYLRFGPHGKVERNRRAVATTANQQRYGTTAKAPKPSASPQWETVATGGRYAWHDHRIHWMSPTAPRAVDRDGRVDLGGPGGHWVVRLIIDDRPTTVTGELVLEDPPSPAPWIAVAIAAAGVLVLVGRRGLPRELGLVACLAGVVAVRAAFATWRAAPPGAGATPLPVAVAGVAVLAAAVATWGPPRRRLLAQVLCAACLVGWALTRLSGLVHAELPTTWSFPADRAATAVALGAGIGLAVLVLWPSPMPSEPESDAEQEPLDGANRTASA